MESLMPCDFVLCLLDLQRQERRWWRLVNNNLHVAWCAATVSFKYCSWTTTVWWSKCLLKRNGMSRFYAEIGKIWLLKYAAVALLLRFICIWAKDKILFCVWGKYPYPNIVRFKCYYWTPYDVFSLVFCTVVLHFKLLTCKTAINDVILIVD